jgi:hypothetical protein
MVSLYDSTRSCSNYYAASMASSSIGPPLGVKGFLLSGMGAGFKTGGVSFSTTNSLRASTICYTEATSILSLFSNFYSGS